MMRNLLKAAAVGAVLATSALAPTSANAAVILFDVTDIFSNDPFGSPLNEVYTIDIGGLSEVVGIGWDVTLYADPPSWLSELVVAFSASDQAFVLDLTPGVGDDFSGTASYSSGGIVDLVGLGFNFPVLSDGLLRLEFWESYDDYPDDWDGIWIDGTLAIEYNAVPEPATWAMMITGFGLVGHAVRRRRANAIAA